MDCNSKTKYLMDPTGEIESRPRGQLASRPLSLQGSCIGILSNQKPNVAPLLDEITNILVKKYKVRKVVKEYKLNQSVPADENIINRLLNCSAVVHGVAD